MDKSMNGAAMTAAALLLAGAAEPALASQTISIPLSQVLSGGGTYSGAFNISSFLQDSSGTNYALSQATVTAYGYSNAAATASYQTTSYIYVSQYSYLAGYHSYSCGFWGNSTCYTAYYGTTYNDNQYNDTHYVDNNQDTLTVSTGNGIGSGSDSSQVGQISSPTYAGSYYTQYGYVTGNSFSVYNQNQTDGYYGSIVALATLTSDDLLAATSSGLVNYTVKDAGDAITLNNMSLNFSVQAVPQVPEPATWAMMVAGFGLVGAATRHRRKRDALA